MYRVRALSARRILPALASARPVALLPRTPRRTFAASAAAAGAAGGGGGGSSSTLFWTLALLGGGAGVAYYLNSAPGTRKFPAAAAAEPVRDYQAVYNAIAARLESDPEYDDGSYGPVLVRLAWHASGTYDAATRTGGSNGATMRFAPESDHAANAGLAAARTFLEPIKAQFPWISFADLWTLAGIVAIQEMGGPTIPWRPGRSDVDVSALVSPPDGRLPDASQGAAHIRAIFNRMGFDDQEIVALSGAHALGRAHTDRSGYDGPWTFSPVTVSNEYFRLLLEEKWVEKKWKGPKQFVDKTTGTLMMLPTDMELVKDKSFRTWTEVYAKDEARWLADFAKAFQKLEELGVPFPADSQPMTLKPTA